MMHIYTHTCADLRDSDVGSTVELSGWINRKRDHGQLVFIDRVIITASRNVLSSALTRCLLLSKKPEMISGDGHRFCRQAYRGDD